MPSTVYFLVRLNDSTIISTPSLTATTTDATVNTIIAICATPMVTSLLL